MHSAGFQSKVILRTSGLIRAAKTLSAIMLAAFCAPAFAAQVGTVLACYACQNTGNTAIDAALAANPGVASDGILFAFVNTSSAAITGGVFSVSAANPDDSFVLPTLAAGSTFILIPGVTSDGASHPASGFFGLTGVMDTSDAVGGLTDSSIFRFAGLESGLAVTSKTSGTSTSVPGTFTPGDPGLIKPFRGNPMGGSTSFIGLGPSGDGGCSNCYFGQVAALNTSSTTPTPEPESGALALIGLGAMGWLVRRGRIRKTN